jgi:hypothetical protein
MPIPDNDLQMGDEDSSPSASGEDEEYEDESDGEPIEVDEEQENLDEPENVPQLVNDAEEKLGNTIEVDADGNEVIVLDDD